MPVSLWVATTPETDFPPLDGELAVDVAVVGAGIAGITAAVLLKRAGKSVALVEAERIAHGATGYTTAKVTAGHGLIYQHLEKHFGDDGARLYAEANSAAIERIATLVQEHAIDCDFERKANYVYGESDDERSRIENEVAAAKRAGLAASFVADPPLPFPVSGAIRLDDQAQFHPRKYLLPLARSLAGDGSHVLEVTRVLDVKDGSPCRVRTDRGEVTARDVVVASHLPILDRGLFFAKAHPHASYAVAARVEEARAPDGMFLNAGTPTRSLRTASDAQGLLLLLGGAGHKPGEEPDTGGRYRELEEFGSRHFGTSDFPYRWTTMDYMPVDRVPYVGRLRRGSEHVYVATGFNKWGMTNSTVAAIILSDAILGRPNPWSRLYDSKRLSARASAPKFVKENTLAGVHFVRDRIGGADRGQIAELAPGEGRMLRIRGRKTAVYRDDDGRVHAMSPVCRHLGCIVAWNPVERTWDCPCHGSRYRGDGTVVHGPATKDLKQRAHVA